MVNVAFVCGCLEGRFLGGLISATVARKRAWGWNFEALLFRIEGLAADCLMKRASMFDLCLLAKEQKKVGMGIVFFVI